VQVHLAVPHSHLRCSSGHYDCGAPTRVSAAFLQTSSIFQKPTLVGSQSNIEWECDNGGQLWTASAEAGYQTNAGFPSGFCAAGFSSIYSAFIVGLLVDIGFQVCGLYGYGGERVTDVLFWQLYMYFLTWRFSKRLEHYADMKGPFSGGE